MDSLSCLVLTFLFLRYIKELIISSLFVLGLDKDDTDTFSE